MKLDKIRFGLLCGLVVNRGAYLSESDLEQMDAIINIDVPVQDVQHNYPSTNDINHLMFLMSEGNKKIEAIKLHRNMTGWGLKESKEEVEKYWPEKKKTAAQLYAEMYAELGEDKNIPFDIVKEFLDRFVSRAGA